MVKRGHNPVFLHIQRSIAVLLSGTGKIGAFRHHQAARFALGHLKLLGDGSNGPVRGLSPDNHLCQLRVDAVDQALLVGPAPITESLVVSRPWPGEDLCDGFLIDGVHGPAHTKATLDLKSGVIIAALIHQPGSLINVVQLVGIKHLSLLLDLQLESIQTGDVHPGAGVFKLFHPGTIKSVLLAMGYVFAHRPVKLCQLIRIEEPLCLCQRDLIIGSKTLIPYGHLALNLSLGTGKLSLQVFHIRERLVKQCILHVFHTLGPIVRITLSCHHPHRPLQEAPGQSPCRCPRFWSGWPQRLPGRGQPWPPHAHP